MHLLDSVIVDKTQYLIFTQDEVLSDKNRRISIDNGFREIDRLWSDIIKSEVKLLNPNFIKNAKSEIVEAEERKWKDSMIKLLLTENKLALFLGIESSMINWQ
jgi:valyl-tRNA synthetase